jgi:CheY-like chemotaxis protein
MAKRILVIDSDESFANVLAAAISKSGLTPLTATNSEHGMTLAKQENPDLIVVCVEAQPTNGYMLCTRLKKDEKLKSTPVILTSANATPDSFEKHKKLKTRAEDYLIKPFPASALVEKASQLLGVEMAGADGAVPAHDDESLGLGNLVPSDDEPIRLTDDDVRDASPVDEEMLVEEDVEEVVQLDESAPQGDDDMEMFDQAFESLKPIEPAPLERPHLRLAPEPESGVESAARDEETLSAPTEVSAPSDDQILAGFSSDEDLPMAVPENESEEIIEDEPAVLAGSDDAALDEPLEAQPEMAEVVEEKPAAGQEQPAGGDEMFLEGPAVSDLEARIAELEGALADKTAEMESARQSSPSAELQRVKEARNRQEKEAIRLKEELHEKDKQLLALEEQQTALEAQNQELRDEARKRESASKGLQQRADALAAAAKKLERELASAREELKSGQAAKAKAAEADKLRKELAEAKGRIEALTTEMSGVRELQETESAQLRAEIEKVRAEMEAVRSEAAEAMASSGQNEERAVKAYQKIKSDEKLREKTRKALEIALALLQDNAVEPAEDREHEKRAV